MPKRPATIDLVGLPPDISDDERAMRTSLYEAWVRSADEFREQLLYMADFLEERGHPDYMVCRSEWVPRRFNRQGTAQLPAWWCWSVKPPQPHGWSVGKAIPRTPSYNFFPWLCWPQGWVRFTGGYQLRDGFEPIHIGMGFLDPITVPDAWCVCIQPHSTHYNTPAANRHGRLEWTRLFWPVETSWERVETKPQPSLFDGVL